MTKIVRAKYGLGLALLMTVLMPGIGEAAKAKGPSSADIKKHSSQTLKKTVPGVSARECAAACAQERSFACESYDYRQTERRCDLHDGSNAGSPTRSMRAPGRGAAPSDG